MRTEYTLTVKRYIWSEVMQKWAHHDEDVLLDVEIDENGYLKLTKECLDQQMK